MDHSLKAVVMDVVTPTDCFMLTIAVAAWTVIITSMMVTLHKSRFDSSPWQCDLRNDQQY
jgi:hypothetical protein